MIKYLQSLEKFGIHLGLERITYLLNKLGDPHLKFKSIHIAGTNGKGSTAAMIASILKEAGYKVGLYTSPHLLDYRERIKINGKDISEEDFNKGLELVKNIACWTKSPTYAGDEESVPSNCVGGTLSAAKHQPTVFEALTAVAFWYFAKKKVDCAVVEVGMGGRLDATNVVTPLVSVITNIDYEHTEILGKTLSKIAYEKAGIIKPGVPVVTAENKTEPLKVIEKICRKKNASLFEVRSWVKGKEASLEVRSGLLGRHQRVNTLCTLLAILLADIKVTKSSIREGLRKVSWLGRFQIISKKPLIILDGAHNPAGAKVLRVTIEELYPQQKFTLIFGAQEDKDYLKMLKILAPVCSRIILTQSSHKEAALPEDLAVCLDKQGISYISSRNTREALEQINGDEKVLITGSLYLVADALSILT